MIDDTPEPDMNLGPIGSHEPKQPKRIGFLKDLIKVPPDFNRMSETDIEAEFSHEG
jgi:hypothetical protein